MNFAKYAVIHARHLPEKVCLIERTPSIHHRRDFFGRDSFDAAYVRRKIFIRIICKEIPVAIPATTCGMSSSR
jgi:hypothetical protein